MSEKIAFLGLGAMGFGMATNLVKTGHSVTGFDVWTPTLERFLAAGGQTATTPREVVKDAKYVVFMVATAAQANSALFDEQSGAIHSLPKDVTVILSSTGPPEYVPNIRAALDEKYGRKDVQVVDAPVSGGTIRAANGTLTILASGPGSALEAAMPVLKAMAGSNLYLIPGGLGAGTKVKMVHQVLAAMGFAAALGLNTREVFEAVKESEGASFMFGNRVPHMLEDDKTVYSALNIIVKDMGIVTAGGRSAQFPLFLSSVTEQVLAAGVSAGYGLVDDSALTSVYLPKSPDLVLKQASASSTSDSASKLKLVLQAMAGVHLVAAAEAMSLGAKVGLETKKLFEIISTAAGTSWMFVDRVPQMLSGKWASKKSIDDVISDLTSAIEEANRLKYPLHLTGTALQLCQQAEMRGLGKESDVAISRIWDGEKGALFPKAGA
ncbi:L-threonate dehydrogenase [Hyphodiscus hymeniophilus]|uniref:L-threonate dehydrogenase n=1 Tax=Hyphodiscus hymeniophilus TaxID=353542 RepID=A0A9P6SK85_9HELO|nr:L-threonate dehydrogenase [Hyphodiscus hymeniophilus]